MKKMLEGFGANGKIAGVKDNTPHMMSFDGMASVVKQFDVPLYSGFGEKWYKYQYPWGADGLATPFGNFFPRHFARDASTEIYQKLNIIQESIIHPFSIKRR